MTEFDILVVGAGHGGAQAVILLRQLGFAGTIGLVGAEPELPYERPPLSKDYLADEKSFERMLIRPSAFWTERDIQLVAGTRITRLDARRKRATSENGTTFGYGRLVWAAGGAPRRLSCAGGSLLGVHSVRCRADVDAIRAELAGCRRVAVIGGGYIGLEAAAVLNKIGKEVVLIEALDRVLARVAAHELSRFYEAEHRARGVEVLLSEAVECIEGEPRARGVRLASGRSIDVDMAIVGIGIEPVTHPLIMAGAEGENGVDVDEYCRTSLPDVYAIGDCASHVNRFAGGARVRLESVQNAHDQAAVAVKHMLGTPQPYDSVPWFWSNQYDLRLQTVGLSIGYDQTIVRGTPGGRSFSVVYLKDRCVIALDCVNATKDYVQGRKLVLDRASPDPEKLSDASVALKELY